MIRTAQGELRLPSLKEREKLMGCDDDYVSEGLRPKFKGELGLTKSGKRTGQEERVVLNSQVAIFWLTKACDRRSSEELLLRGGADHFSKMFQTAP